MSNRTALLSAIEDLVEERKATGQVVDASACASRLATEYPQSDVTLDEIARLVELAAVKQRAALLVGGGRPH